MNINIFRIAAYFFITTLEPTEIQSCSFPVTWDGTWYDSTEGTITFSRGTNQVTSGWIVTLGASSVTSWTCLAEDTSNRHFLFRGDSSLSFFSSTIIPYLCVYWTNVTDYSFYYYILADYQSNGVNERAYLEQYNPSITSWSTATYCSPTSPPGDEEFHMAVKQGFDSTAKIDFPSILSRTLTYTYNLAGTVYCSGNSHLDICTDTTTATFNYTVCSTKQVFSNEGIVYCVATIVSGITTYVSVYNPGTINNVNYYRFSCMAVESSGTGNTASVSAGSCEQSQAPTVATSTGGVLSMAVVDNCTATTTSVSTSTTTTATTTTIPTTTTTTATTTSIPTTTTTTATTTSVPTTTTTATTTSVPTTTTATTTSVPTTTTTTANGVLINSNTYNSSTNSTTPTEDWFCSTLDSKLCYGILSCVCIAGIASFVGVAFTFCIYASKDKRGIRNVEKVPEQLTIRKMREPMSLPLSTRISC